MLTEAHVFVYGTLRRGGSNHFRMAGAEFVAEATVCGRLYGIDWYPGLVIDESAQKITGEVYQVPANVLEDLDAFEGADYRRVRVSATLADASVLLAWVWEWLGPVDEARRIMSGDWLSPPQSTEP